MAKLRAVECREFIKAVIEKAEEMGVPVSIAVVGPEGLLIGLAALTNGKIAASGGGAPVFRGAEMVGAYGISGGTSQQDEVMAQYARAKVGWAHESTVEPNDDVKKHI